jgi:hypothetical protein
VVDEHGQFREDNFSTAMAVLQNAGDAAKVEGALTSEADPECLTRILIFIHPGSNIIIRRGEGKICLLSYHFCSHKDHKIVNNFVFEKVDKKLQYFLPRNLSLRYKKYGFFGSEIRKNLSMVKKAPDPDPQHWR